MTIETTIDIFPEIKTKKRYFFGLKIKINININICINTKNIFNLFS